MNDVISILVNIGIKFRVIFRCVDYLYLYILPVSKTEKFEITICQQLLLLANMKTKNLIYVRLSKT